MTENAFKGVILVGGFNIFRLLLIIKFQNSQRDYSQHII